MYVYIALVIQRQQRAKTDAKKENKKSDINKNRNTSWKGIVYI